MTDHNKTKNKIIVAASELFVEKGLDATSVREITDRAGVSVSAINYHFESKENLFKEIITNFGKGNLENVNKSLKEPKTAEEVKTRLDFFLKSLIDYLFENYTQTILVLKGVDFTKNEYGDALKVFLSVYETMNNYFKICQKKNFITKKIKSEFIAGLLLNHISGQVNGDAINEQHLGKSLKQEKYRNEWIQNTLGIILDGCTQGKK